MSPISILIAAGLITLINIVIVVLVYNKIQDNIVEFKNSFGRRIMDVKSYISVVKNSSLNDNIDIKEELLRINKRIDKIENKHIGGSIIDRPAKRNKKS